VTPVKTILITGAAGDVGRRLAPLLADTYRLRLSDLKEPAGMASGTEFVKADLADLAQVEAAVAGVDGIIHLGTPSSLQTSSVATTCSRRLTATGSSVSCSPRRTMR
jgi:nucleoside-diphosphate-sugar epimerase